MTPNDTPHRLRMKAGFTLPAVLVVVAALLILVIGLLSVFSIERRTARSYVDLQRSEMAARAGLEDIKALLDKETSNDEFLVVQHTPPLPADARKELEAPQYLYIARGSKDGNRVKYTYHPLFTTSNDNPIPGNAKLQAPAPEDLYGKDPEEIKTMPWMSPSYGAWVPIKGTRNGKEQTVARYAVWVEDLQGKLNPKVAGNDFDSGKHQRPVWDASKPYTGVAGIYYDPQSDKAKPMNNIGLYALDNEAKDIPGGDLSQRVVQGREAMISPNSILGALGYAAPLKRSEDGFLDDPTATALEKNTVVGAKPYDEQPTVPFAVGIDPDMAGRPKLNLNKMLSQPRDAAISDFAKMIEDCLPNFAKKGAGGYNINSRPGAFKEDYLKTLAAGAFDYADSDGDPSEAVDSYRGMDGQPVFSEIVLLVDYKGATKVGTQTIATFTFKVFVEVWNMTTLPIGGKLQVSYENAFRLGPIGTSVKGPWFDSPTYMDNKSIATHNMAKINGKYYTFPVNITLQPDQYRFFELASIDYRFVLGNVPTGNALKLLQSDGERVGMSLRWNDRDVDRVPIIDRDEKNLSFSPMSTAKWLSKAVIPGHSYGEADLNIYWNNMGDPRLARYMTSMDVPAAENAMSYNLSPNRRNVRRGSVYESPNHMQVAVYGRVWPSEWPDRGHDSSYGGLATIPQTEKTNPILPKYLYTLPTYAYNAPQRISNAGRFYSATELGNVYDPLMWKFVYDNLKNQGGSGTRDTKMLRDGKMPQTRMAWADVSPDSEPDPNFGGGNTLRIGRYEHKRFDTEGMRASYLLDLFHVGKSTSSDKDEREGNVVTIDGQVNLNTATRDSIRALAIGTLRQDPQIRKLIPNSYDTQTLAQRSGLITLGTPTIEKAADVIADAIIYRRPYACMGELAGLKDKNNENVFGNVELYGNNLNNQNVVWSDAAAEELFGRVHDASTFRSRNFRVWVVGQSLSGSETNPEVLAETRKVYTVFADPGERMTDGSINKTKSKSRVIYENSF